MSRTRGVRVAALDDLAPGEGRVVRVGAAPVALFRVAAREVRAIDAHCPHRGGPLADGIVTRREVTCPLHGWKIDLDSGRVVSAAGRGGSVRAYGVRVIGDDVIVEIPARRCAPDLGRVPRTVGTCGRGGA